MQPAGLPLWGYYVVTSLLSLLAADLGFRAAKHRRSRSLHEEKRLHSAQVGAMLGLLAFILAFTFGLAASRFDARKGLVLDEANAIGMTYLRAALLADPQRSELRKLLREYADIRVLIVQPDTADQALRRSEELQSQLWSQVTSATLWDYAD